MEGEHDGAFGERMTTGISQSPLMPYASGISGRRDQAFPVLSETEIARMARFGERQEYRRGERLITAGERAPGMFVVLKGALTATRRDGLGSPGRRRSI